MATQKRAPRQPREDENEVESVTPAVLPGSQVIDSDIDSMLDEIDTVLEQNAEEFVKSFIQKGGQ